MPFSDLNAPSAALRVCIDEVQSGRISGEVYSQRLISPMPFADLGTLLLRLDEVLEAQNFPQAFQKPRRFAPVAHSIPAASSPERGLSLSEVEARRGAASTFVLHVISRRCSSWQGKVDWLDGEAPQYFASELELTHLLEARVQQDKIDMLNPMA